MSQNYRRCVRCTKPGANNTGPDGARTLCIRCYNLYRTCELVVYQSINGTLSVLPHDNWTRVRVVKFPIKFRGRVREVRDLTLPIVVPLTQSSNDRMLIARDAMMTKQNQQVRQKRLRRTPPVDLATRVTSTLNHGLPQDHIDPNDELEEGELKEDGDVIDVGEEEDPLEANDSEVHGNNEVFTQNNVSPIVISDQQDPSMNAQEWSTAHHISSTPHRETGDALFNGLLERARRTSEEDHQKQVDNQVMKQSGPEEEREARSPQGEDTVSEDIGWNGTGQEDHSAIVVPKRAGRRKSTPTKSPKKSKYIPTGRPRGRPKKRKIVEVVKEHLHNAWDEFTEANTPSTVVTGARMVTRGKGGRNTPVNSRPQKQQKRGHDENDSRSFNVKVEYGEDLRRMRIDESWSFTMLEQEMGVMFHCGRRDFKIKVRDEENDFVTVSSDKELREMLRLAVEHSLSPLRAKLEL